MNISGVGIDIALEHRITHLARFPNKQIAKILTPHELSTLGRADKRVKRIGIYFSAKEAVFKSLGLKTFGPKGFREIEISIERHGACRARLTGSLARQAGRRTRHIYLTSAVFGGWFIAQAICVR